MKMREACGVVKGSPLVDCDGVQLAVSREGAGPPVVCLHAVGHGGRDFEAFADAVKDRFEVIRIDWPGHGRSAADTVPPSAARYAELLGKVLERLQIRNPIIVGNSIGGAAAILHASRQPVRALVLCDPGGLVPVTAFVRRITGLFVRFFRAGERGAGWFDRAYAFYYRRIVLPSPAAAEQRMRIIAAGRESAPVLRLAWESFGRPDADIRSIAAGLDVPIWCAWAGSDRVIPLWMCKPAIRKLGNASLSIFRGGHSAFLEQPAEFAGEFLEFANGLESICGKKAEDTQLEKGQGGRHAVS